MLFARQARLLLLAVALMLAVPTTAPAASSAPLIVIDPGHGGPYSNANANGLREETLNLQIALELRTQLQARGYRVSMTRTTDRAVTLADIPTWNYSASSERWYHRRDGHRGLYGGIPRDDLQARCNLANRTGADLFISIHNNGSADRAARGTETIASAKDARGIELSRLVHRRIVARTGLRDRGVKQMDLYVCRWTNAPSILVEGGFISNPGDAYKLKQASFRRKIAVGIAEGVQSWFATDPNRAFLPRTSAANAESAAVAASRADFPNGAPTVVVARADEWMEAPSAPAFAQRVGGPLLWIGPSGPSTETADELSRLAPERIVAAGLDGSFDETITGLLANALPATSTVELLSAPDRAALAASIAATMGPSASGEVLVAAVNDSAATLAAASAAARTGTPLLLAVDGVLTTEGLTSLETLAPTTVVLVGPSTTLPVSAARGIPAVRLDGSDFAARASAVNARYYRSTATGSLKPVVADFGWGAEYLTAAGLAARRSQPLVPVAGRVLPTYTRYWITNRRPQIGTFTIFDAHRTIPGLTDNMLVKSDRL